MFHAFEQAVAITVKYFKTRRSSTSCVLAIQSRNCPQEKWGSDIFSPEPIEVIPKLLHRIDRGNSHYSARMYYMIVYDSCFVLLTCALSANVHNVKTMRFMLMRGRGGDRSAAKT